MKEEKTTKKKTIKKTVSEKVETKSPKKAVKKNTEPKKITKKESVKPKSEVIKETEVKEEKKYSVLGDKTTELENTNLFLNRYILFALIIGIMIGLLLMSLFMPKKIATLKDGTSPILTVDSETITADDLYNDMKGKYAMNSILDLVDSKILDKKYETTEEIKKEVDTTADNYITQYTSYYGYTEEVFLNENGFKDKDDFISYLTLSYKRNLYYTDYINSLITDEKINTYYKDSVFGEINAKYIMITKTEDDKDTKLAKEILEKLSKGSTYDSIVSEYETEITSKDLEYVKFTDVIDSTIKSELLKLSNNSYTKNYVETTDGYAIIFRLDQKEKESLETVKESIISNIKSDIETNDQNISYKAFIELRKENKLQFSDTDLGAKYEEYCETYK